MDRLLPVPQPGHPLPRRSEKVYPPQHYDDIAADVIRLVAEQAEPFWREVALG